MLLFISMLLAIAFSLLLASFVPKAPWTAWIFYVIAILIDLLIVFSTSLDLPPIIWKTVVLVNGRALFAFGLFTVVMFIGVLKEGSKLKNFLVPVRAELSIVAAILTVGHVIRYLGVYSPRVLSNPNSVANGMLVSFVVALIISILLVLLTITSFKAIKKAMNAKAWKNVQRLAYPFFVMIYLHIFLIMVRPATMGADGALTSLIVYGVIIGAYVVLRVLRYRDDKAKAAIAA